jgi:hypothetical protein
MNRTTLVIPALRGKVDGPAIAHVLAYTTHHDLQQWEQQKISPTLRKRRGAFLNVTGGHTPGTLECP